MGQLDVIQAVRNVLERLMGIVRDHVDGRWQGRIQDFGKGGGGGGFSVTVKY